MNIAVISDIHANLPALEAVLRDINKRKADKIICLGDIIGKGPSTKETIDLCRGECELVIQGNWDRFLYEEFAAQVENRPISRWYMDSAGDERMEYLGSLPHSTELTLGGKRVRLFHAHPLNFNRYFADSPLEKRLELLEPDADIAVYGDIHYAYMQIVQGKTIVNAGSVGNPLDIAEASYVLLGGNETSVGVNFVRVPYDIERAVSIARTANSPDLEGYISELRTAKYFRRGQEAN